LPDSPTRGAAGARASWPPGSAIFEPLKSALLCNWAELTLGLPTLLGALAVPFVWCALAAIAVVVGWTLMSARSTLALRAALRLAVNLQTRLFCLGLGPVRQPPLDWRWRFALGVLDAGVWPAPSSATE
jgi:hypothetical protein